MAILTAALKAEIVNDPQGIGYASAWAGGLDGVVADMLNAANRTVDREYAEGWEIFDAVVPSEAQALQATPRQLLSALFAVQKFRLKSANTRAWFTALFAAGTTTRQNLAALQTKVGSRAEELWGDGAVVTPQDVAEARKV